MALSVLKYFGSRVFNAGSHTLNVSNNSSKTGKFIDLTILSPRTSASVQITSVRWRTRVDTKKKKGQFPPDFCKVSALSIKKSNFMGSFVERDFHI